MGNLARCPCGQTPAALCINEGHTCKYAWVSGDCCGEWNVEFRTGYHKTDTPECMELAVDAWNRAERNTPKEPPNADPS